MLNPLILALSFGTCLGVTYFLLTILHIIRGRGPIIHFMGHHLRGYRRNFKGAIIAFIWGAFIGFASGFLIALFYNLYLGLFS